MARDTYQAISPIQSLIGVNMVRHYLTTPRLAFNFFPCAEPDLWAPLCAYAELSRIAEVDFEVAGRRYGVFGHDWRTMPTGAWLDLMAAKEMATEPHLTPSRPVDETLILLSQTEFQAAVRDALRDLSHPELLSHNPLLRSRLIIQRAGVGAGESERSIILQAQLKEAADSLQRSPREMKFYRALYHTYLQPAPTQEQAAELLDIPFSTFRRHLKTGITRITDILWQQEVDSLK
jgi:hypothetical protein